MLVELRVYNVYGQQLDMSIPRFIKKTEILVLINSFGLFACIGFWFMSNIRYEQLSSEKNSLRPGLASERVLFFQYVTNTYTLSFNVMH